MPRCFWLSDKAASAMFWLGLLLIPGILAENEIEVSTVDNYIITISDGPWTKRVLIRIEATPDSSDDLNLSGLNLDYINEGVFENLEIRNLSLANNRLKMLPDFAFESLRNLEYLSLADNMLGELSYYFGGMNNLIRLDIRNNNIALFCDRSFYGLPESTIIIADRNTYARICSVHINTRSDTFVSACIVDGVLKSLEVYEGSNYRPNTKECPMRIRKLRGDLVNLFYLGIKGFEKNWYRLSKLHVRTLDLRANDITNITSEMLNDLPRGLTEVKLDGNSIETVENDVINNFYLVQLGLSWNPIRYIGRDAFVNTGITEISVSGVRSEDSNRALLLPKYRDRVYQLRV